MRRFVFLLVIIFALKSSAEDLPTYRPALIGKSPEAIINRIDENMLLKAGQKKALIMFFALVDKDGTVKSSSTYRGTPESKLLEQELQRALTNAKEKAEISLKEKEVRLTSSDGKVKSTDARLQKLTRELGFMTIKAPRAGLVYYANPAEPWNHDDIKVGNRIHQGNTVITYGAGDTITLQHVTLGSLHATDFLIV